jgi:hypothetical protein
MFTAERAENAEAHLDLLGGPSVLGGEVSATA